jgi:cytochrome o ubiquinol oxidase subunit 2
MRMIVACMSVLLTLLLSACSRGMLNPQGQIASEQLHLFCFATLIMLIVVIPVFILIFYFSFKYRASNLKAKYRPTWAHNLYFEIIWWGIPFIIIIVLGIVTWTTSHRLSPYRPIVSKTKPVTIQVVALNWKWLFIYPKQHIATVNVIQLPIHTPVRFLITSDAPMNSFIIPQLGGQIYAMTGMQTQLHLMASKNGTYAGLSVNYSGKGFSGMRFKVHVASHKAFEHWVSTVKQSPHHLTLARYQHLRKNSQNNPAAYFSAVMPKLFQHIMNTYNHPTVSGGAGKPQEL